MNTEKKTYPWIGFGTYNAKGGDNLLMIKTAIEAGYRYFDTASLYGTERALGQAIKESGIPREEFILASKAWHDEMGTEKTRQAFFRSLERLQTEYMGEEWFLNVKASIDTANALLECLEMHKSVDDVEMVDITKI